ncbi:fungal-specific transcription factor domain-containing protein [Podospora aff. communis PSN243]|uniref:Fungal-specific transcription factor domain-containing protein n=1 Tax=Podospora aff. communis PSN243 TaxID=3040156 RepID=A0AAV9GLM4_9PEZI|nr:fungal-specific transcription factor domain-containing protein [Podospora aff. communis PSN243]
MQEVNLHGAAVFSRRARNDPDRSFDRNIASHPGRLHYTKLHPAISWPLRSLPRGTAQMSEPARKRRIVGSSQWSQHPCSTSQLWSSDSVFTASSDSASATQYGSTDTTSSHSVPLHDPLQTVNSPLHHNCSGFVGPETPDPLLDLIPPLSNSTSPFCSDTLGRNAPVGFSTGATEGWQDVFENCIAGPADRPDTNLSYALPLEDIWTDTSLYRLDGGTSLMQHSVVSAADVRSRKRGFDKISNDWASTSVPPVSSHDLKAVVPSLFPSVPNIRSRATCSPVANPFLESSDNRLPTLANRVRHDIPKNGVINGYIKIRMTSHQVDDSNAADTTLRLSRSQNRAVTVVNPDDGGPLGAGIPLLPPNFSTGMRLDRTDKKLFCFHLNAYCPGRTLLPGNYWREQVAAIAVKYECARHALLAFASAYVLDYVPTEEMRKRANFHYRAAVRLLDEALAREETYAVGQDDGVVVAMILVLSNDIVNWESRRPPGREPLWREGSRAARVILDRADPGYRYWKPQNVQSSVARVGNANWVAYTEICAQPVAPLAAEHTTNLFPWLLQGSKEEVHKIQGVTGVCPKLLHIFSQITHLAALLKKDPDSTIVPLAALKVRNRLAKFWQWSDDSLGYASGDELMQSCVLDEHGKVFDPVKVTDLSAYAWVPTAEMYLHMRVYRKPRSHPHVLRSLKRLIQCIERLPCTGPLFTSQSPFFCVFLMAIVSYQEEDRNVARAWFEEVVGAGHCRSSVPPVWTAVQQLWTWLDSELNEPPYDEDQPIGDRRMWWEDMVHQLVKENGILSLV